MQLIEALKFRVLEGKIEIPKTPSDLVLNLDCFLSVSKSNDDVGEKLNEFKSMFLSVHKSKSGGKRFCYISRIKGGILGSKNKKFNDAYKFVFGIDAITSVITTLIIEKKIEIIGKKVYLINQEQ
tara:strand:- start:1905 stop:2279 length:375 start_codon:yes stop_codon:yes gene_type:complete